MSLSISAVGGYDTLYPVYNANPVTPVDQAGRVTRGSEGTTDTESGKKVEKTECQTCKNRKYVDGSNEGNVSFKTPGHISPESSGAKVMAHEKEHVANAVAKGNQADNKLVSAQSHFILRSALNAAGFMFPGVSPTPKSGLRSHLLIRTISCNRI